MKCHTVVQVQFVICGVFIAAAVHRWCTVTAVAAPSILFGTTA